MKDVMITVRIPGELKESLIKYGVEVSRVVRRALEEEVKRRRLEELKRIASELGDLFSKIPDEEIVRIVKESRKYR